jgi:Glu-tRNA(Gln) amidotransferase subunit E-like FAD-binding protein
MEQILIQLRLALKTINAELNNINEEELKCQLNRLEELRIAQQACADLIEDLQESENL